MAVSLDGKPKATWEEKLRLVNQPEKKKLRILQHKKDEKRIAFEDYEGLFLNKKLKLSSNLNYLFTRSFFRKLTPKKLLNILG